MRINSLRILAPFALIFILMSGCRPKKGDSTLKQNREITAQNYASGFSIEKSGDITVIKVTSAWPGAKKVFSYALVPREKLPVITLPNDAYDAIVPTPVKRLVVTSTTHIPALEALGELDALVGFPSTDLISTPAAREKINAGNIQELGINENINTEILLELAPEVVIGFGVDGTNKTYELLQNSGIPVVYNSDWTEKTPLGKAEWIRFFGPFFNKETKADSIFASIEKSYHEAKDLAKNVGKKPTVLTGGLYKDVWYVAGGDSWLSRFLADANADYLWKDSPETGSIGLSLEEVLAKGIEAEFWFNPNNSTSYNELQKSNTHYSQFSAFTQKKIYSNTLVRGETGGILFYELASQRPDLVLRDFIAILHPGILLDFKPHFFRPLE